MIRICHLSDTQIRNFQRHEEYLRCFDNLYDSLSKNKPDFIVHTGDIVHQKSNISPELVQITSDFFKNLLKIAPLHIIPGNHDANLSNMSRLDAITPIVDNINDKNLHYYKKSGVYFVDERFSFVVFSCFDKKEEWTLVENVDSSLVNIGLYHGMINGCELQNGMIVEDSYDLSFFMQKVDYLLMGDIHEKQFLNKERTAAYPGSTLQQNYGESLHKGYLLWDIENKNKHNVEFVEIPNICPFYTLNLSDDLRISDKYKIQKKARIRVISRQLNVIEKKDIESKIKDWYQPEELIFEDEINAKQQKISLDSFKTKIENLSDVQVQERLIKEFLQNRNLSQELMENVLKLNKIYDVEVRKDEDVLRNIFYRILKIDFSNLFSFGENNVFDFTKCNGIVGVFGKNATGKSSFAVDVPGYTIFNKISKKGVVKNDLVINENKTWGKGSIELEINKDRYCIDRTTTLHSKPGKRKGKTEIQGKTELNFKILREDGEEELKNGLERADTDKIIRQYFGTAEDFMLTSVAPQWQLLNFIENGTTERRKILGRYFDIDIFEKKHDLANEDRKKIKEKLKTLSDSDIGNNISFYEREFQNFQKILHDLQQKQLKIHSQREELDEKISSLRNKIINVKIEKNIDELVLDSQIKDLQQKYENKKNEAEVLLRQAESIKREQSSIEQEIEKINIKFLQEKSNEKISLDDEITGYDFYIKNKQEILSNIEKRIKDLSKYECISNPNCCMLKELKKSQEQCEKIREDISLVQCKHKKLIEKSDEIKKLNIKDNIKNFEKLTKQKEKNEWSLKIFKRDGTILKGELISIKDKIKDKIEQKQQYILQKEQIEKNCAISEEVSNKEKERNILDASLKQLFLEISTASKDCGNAEADLKQAVNKKMELEKLQKEFSAYDYFLECMSKEGISQRIINDNLGVVNSEIKKILNNVNFDVFLESENDKDLEIYFKPRKGKKRIIELASGMEKTISALAIRVALTNITTLPKSNVLILDEIFGPLDPEYQDSVVSMLEYFKQLFECVIVIMHENELKDIVDHVIEVTRDDKGHSVLGV